MDASAEDACARLLRAAAERARAVERTDTAATSAADRAIHALVATLEGEVRTQVAMVCRKQARLLSASGYGEEDLGQEVARRLIEKPPLNPEGRDASAVIAAWIRSVTVRLMLDGQRRRKRMVSVPRDEDGASELEPPASGPSVLDGLTRAEAVLEMREAALSLKSRKHLYEAYLVLSEDPDTPALELAEKIGLIAGAPGEPWPDEYKSARAKAAQYAWKVRERMLTGLAAALRAGAEAHA